MKFFVALLAIGFVANASASKYFTQDELDAHFERFKSDHNRHYGGPRDEQVRKNIFASNLDFIYRHNQEAARGQHSYTVGVNAFADLTVDEYRVYFLSQKPALSKQAGGLSIKSVEGLPSSIDWVTLGKVTPVKNQGSNGAAWAFSSVASLESAHAIKTGLLEELSTQEVTDCCNPYTNPSANGTIFDSIFECLWKVGGVDKASSYPDPSVKTQCKFNKQGIATQLLGYIDINPGNELSLQYGVAQAGPVSVLIDASQQSFMLYTGGVYDEPACSSTTLDHAVAVVGYGTDGGAAFWKVKNSWGAAWGELGYIRMSRNKNNQCGIATSATAPMVLN